MYHGITQILSAKFPGWVRNRTPPSIERRQRPLANQPMPLLLVPNLLAQLLLKRLQQVERDVGRLKVLRIGVVM